MIPRGAWAALAVALLWGAPPALAAAADPLRAIAIAEDERRFAGLREFLGHSDPVVRARAVLAVGRLQDSTTVAALVPLATDPLLSVRREAVFALGQIGGREARAPLEAALADREAEIRLLAIEGLGKLGDKAATPRVVAFLRDPAPALRAEAALSLWRLADSTALDALLERHQDADPTVRWRVLYALERIVQPDRVVLVAALHLDDPDPWVRSYAVRTIGRQRSPRGTAYALAGVADPVVAVAVNALRAVQQIGDSTCATCPSILAGALGHGDPYVRVTAATTLAERFTLAAADTGTRRRTLEALEERLGDPDAATRGAAARALVAHTGPQALERVRGMLADSSIYVRVAVLQSLALLPPGPSTRLLLDRLDPRTPLFERTTSAEVLGTLRVREAIPMLRAGLADTSLLFAAACASGLAELGDSASVPALARAYAARAREADADARIGIRDALRALAGRAYADSLERRHAAPSARAAHPDDFHLPSTAKGAVIHTSAGDIEWAFYSADAVQTVKNFVRLARARFFDGDYVHRVVPNFVIQDGDPTGTGSGGPGYTIRCEYNRLRYDPGMVGMALSGKDTGGSQWFVTHSPQHHLNGRYTIFARVTRGMEVVHRVTQGTRVLGIEILE